MNRHERRKAKIPSGFIRRTEAVRRFLDVVLHGAPPTPTVAVSPIVWGINPKDGRQWYFVCASADALGEVHIDQLLIRQDDREMAEQTRGALFAELVARRPVVVHDFDDEVSFARFCVDTWPSDRTRKMLAEIEGDYANRILGDAS